MKCGSAIRARGIRRLEMRTLECGMPSAECGVRNEIGISEGTLRSFRLQQRSRGVL